MEIKILSEDKNAVLKRREVQFEVDHSQTGSAPPRLEVKKALADALKLSSDLVFVKQIKTKTGTSIAVGVANIYESIEQAKFVEPDYILKRNMPPEEPKEKEQEEKK
jgi:small subunit ribosomal protein S24e